MADPIKETIELLREKGAADTVTLSGEELLAMASILEGQKGVVDQLTGVSGRAVLISELCRVFALNDVKLPGYAAICQFLRDYIDTGDYGPIPWPPEDLASLTRFLRDKGYANIDGYIDKPIREGENDNG